MGSVKDGDEGGGLEWVMVNEKDERVMRRWRE